MQLTNRVSNRTMSQSSDLEQLPDLQRPGIRSGSFACLMITQWLTSINDNIFRWLVIGIGKDYVNPGDWGNILMVGSAVFLLPYLILASPAGWLADRFRKVDVIIGCKIAEVVVMCLGVVAIAIGNVPLLFITVGLMGAQSALFAPSKVATIPDLVHDRELSNANGWFGLSTVTATIIGMGLGNWLADFCGDFGQSNLWASAGVLVGIAVIGTFFSLGIRKSPAADPTARFPWNAPVRTLQDLKTLFERRDLFIVALGEMFFWSIGMLATLNIDSFAVQSGGLFETSKLPLLVSLVFGVGLGSVLAGIWSAGRVELGMLHLGAFFIAFFSAALLFVPEDFLANGWELNSGLVLSCAFLMLLGSASGLFDVPLAAYLQKKSPIEKRGAILAADNFLIFAGMFAHSILFGMLGAAVHEGAVENIPRVQQVAQQLTIEQKLAVQKICDGFEQQWVQISESNGSTARPPGFFEILLGAENPKVTRKSESIEDKELAGTALIETWLDRHPEIPREYLYARLLWVEFHHLKSRGELGTLDVYYERFPDYMPLSHQVFQQVGGIKRFTARQIFAIMALATLPVFLFVVWRLPLASLRFDCWWLSKIFFKTSIRKADSIPENMGAIVISNRRTWLDETLFLLFSPRRVRIVSFARHRSAIKQRWLRMWGEIRLYGGPSTIQQGLADARKALAHGELLACFPEPGPSPDGQLNHFDPLLQELMDKAPVPLVPAWIEGVGSRRLVGNRPPVSFFRKIRPAFSITFGEPLDRPTTLFETRQAISEIGALAMSDPEKFVAPARQFIRNCKRRKFRMKIADLAEGEMTGGEYLTRTLILRRLLRRHVLHADEDRVGVLLPPSRGAAVVNMALALDKRVAVNLNYSASEDIINACLEAAGIRHVLTSKQVMSKLGLNLKAEVVELESLRPHLTTGDKAIAAFQAYAVPSGILESSLGLNSIRPDDLMTLVFTSGSTGTPKGVMLTQNNIASNVNAFQQVINLRPDDVLMGILPFFHSFGYTVTLWGNAMIDVGAAYHYTPLDGRQVGKLCEKFKGTVLISTPTFLRGYLKRTRPEQFKSLDTVITGAEKLPPELADAFEQRFGVRPVEGYGATELSPVVSVNIPPGRAVGDSGAGLKEGTIGRPIPGVAAKILDLETGEELGPNQPGMLWVKGPNVMKGYYQREDLTSEVIRDGWYKTGDVAAIDEDGFITITGRISRFSKIGGEMVPHVQIEDALNQLIGIDDEQGIQAVVSAVPDEKKGERLVVVHVPLDISIEELRKGLAEKGLPNLYIPSADSFLEVETIPILGTGKLDLKGIQQLALERFQ